jgi:uncharacterized low-complexity protein
MFIWAKVKIYAALIGASLLAILVAALKIRKSGRDAERVKNLESTIEAMRKKEGVAREVNRLPDGDAADRLRKHWSRD